MAKANPSIESSAADGLNQLNDLVSSAQQRGSTESKALAALKKLKVLAFDVDYQSNQLIEEDFKKVGISEYNIPGLNTIVTFKKIQEGCHVGSFISGLLRNTFFVLKAAELSDTAIRDLISDYCSPHHRLQFAITSDQFHLLCEILCNAELIQKAEKFVDAEKREKLGSKREVFIKQLKKSFMSSHGHDLLRVIHGISSCGDDMRKIVPDEIPKLDLSDTKLSASDVATLCNIIRDSELLHCLSMSRCDLTSEFLQVLADGLQNSKLKISELDVSLNKNMGTNGLSSIGKIVKNNNVGKLKMSDCDLKHEELESFNKHADGAKISDLDVSLNENMGADGLGSIGKLVKNNNVGKLGLAGCGLKQEELESFHKHSNGAKISELDVSENRNMGANGLSYIGRIVKNNSVDKLKMASCDLKLTELDSFNIHGNGAKIYELDISRNRNMGAYGLGSIGRIVRNNNIEKLKLMNCALNHERLKSFSKYSDGVKISEFNVSENMGMGANGLASIGRIVKNNNVDKLIMESCDLKLLELDSFNKHSNGAKIKELDLSLQLPSQAYIFPLYAVCNLLPNVTECLRLTLNLLGKEVISLLQDKLHSLHPAQLKIGLKLQVVGCSEISSLVLDLTSELTSEEYWEHRGAVNYLRIMKEKDKIQRLEAELEKRRETLIKYSDKNFMRSHPYEHLFYVIHSISLRGDDVRRTVPDEIPELYFNQIMLLAKDIVAICSVIRHSSLLHCLTLRDCDLTSEVLQVLADGLHSSKLKIAEFDVSKNTNMDVDGLGSIGRIVKNNNVDKLKMTDCDLKHEELQSFNKHSDGAKISELDVSANKNMGADGLGYIGRIVKNKNVDKLKLESCHLKHDELCLFNKHSDGAKIKQLDLSLQERSKFYIFPLDAVCNLLPNVTECLKLTDNELRIEEISLLQEKLHRLFPTNLKVQIKQQGTIHPESTYLLPDLTSQLTSEEYWKLPDAVNYWEKMQEDDMLRLENLKELFMIDRGYELLRFIHVMCSYGDHVKRIVPDEIPTLDLDSTRLSASDVVSICNVIRHSSLLRCLSLRNCDLTSEVLQVVVDGLQNSKLKISELDVSLNVNMGVDGLGSIGKIVKNNDVDKLGLSGCSLKHEELESFHKHSDGAEIKQLELSCQTTYEHGYHFPSDAVFLIPVTECLNLNDNDLRIEEVSNLQNRLYSLHPTELKIKLRLSEAFELPDLTSELTSEQYWKKPVAANSLQMMKIKVELKKWFDTQGLGTSSVVCEESKLESHSTAEENHIPMEIISKEIGNEGDTIEVGGCFITFPSNTFKTKTLVTAKAKIDPNEWPPGRKGITPSLNVDAKGMTKKAKVKLPTWCIDENDENERIIIEVMHFDEGRNKWKVIHECSLGNSGFIEFKCQKFSPIIGTTLRRILSMSLLYTPVVYRAQREFIIGLHLDTKLAEDNFFKKVKESLGEEVRVKTFPVIACKKTNVIKCEISCSEAGDGFSFDPSGPFAYTIDRPMTLGKPSFDHCVLSGGQTEMDIKIRVNIAKQGKEIRPQVFLHRWKPECTGTSVSKVSDEKVSSPTQSIKSAGDHKNTEVSTGSGSRQPVNVEVNVEVHAKEKSSIVGGTVNTGRMEASYTDYENKVTVVKTPKKEDSPQN